MLRLFTFLLENIILLYGAIILSTYFILAAISGRELLRYIRLNKYTNFNVILSSPFAPSISIIAPSYNESLSIVNNIKALMQLHYNNYEVIIVNDGSKDDTMKKIIQEFDLEKTNLFIEYKIPTQEIKGVYKSKHSSYEKLTVIDKANGGKADALNAGLNISTNQFFVAIDVDSVILPDALLKLSKPFLIETNRRIIATGGVIRIANSCKIENGLIEKIELPKNLWAKFQVLEYTRAFLMGRIAWAKLDGLLLISGALGMFDKEIAVKCGGYNHNTVGEDMEIVVRMRRYMIEHHMPHHVAYIPDPLCWTEVPSDLKTLGRQRNRWTRGTIDTLTMHKKMFFNPTYKKLGMLGYPYWYFFEWLAPIIEAAGMLFVLSAALFGLINWAVFLILLTFIYLFALAFSSYAILYEEFTFRKYERKTHLFTLFLVAFIEPIIYHPLNVYWAIRGNIDYMKGVKTWGEMKRQGFKK